MIRTSEDLCAVGRGMCLFALGVLLAMFQPTAALATNHLVHADEVCGGINGDSNAQYLEIKFLSSQNLWGPQGGEANSRAMLEFFDSTDNLVGTFEFDHNPPVVLGSQEAHTPNLFSALIATADAAALTGFPTPDFTIDRLIIPQAGKVCFKNNPANPFAFFVTICISYGDNVSPDFTLGRLPFVGDTQGAGPPAEALPTTTTAGQVNVQSLKRVSGFGCTNDTCHTNADFDIGDMAPRNTDGDTITIPADSLENQGQPLFVDEPFEGNTRSCGSCHVTNPVVGAPVLTRDDAGGITPQMIADLFASDPLNPLFVAEFDPLLASLEHPCQMHTGNGGNAGTNRGLILENICGFPPTLPLFREPVHIINVKFTGQFGHNNQVTDLQDFSRGAVQQHFPRFIGPPPDMPRNFDPDMGDIAARIPNDAEVVAMEAFMESVRLPSDLPDNFSIPDRAAELDRMIAASVECRGADQGDIDAGRTLFFGAANCSLCHSNAVLAGPVRDTGVVDLAVNDDDGCNNPPDDPQDALNFDGDCAGGRGSFATPPMFGIFLTAPFMHANELGLDEDNPLAALREAVDFYNSDEFNMSPDGIGVGGISRSPDEVDDVTAFLAALLEPIECTGACCLPDGTCQDDLKQSECEALCGFFLGVDTVCSSPQICPFIETGACCKSDNSCEETHGQCACELFPGADYRGDGTECATTVCEDPGACCLPDGTCEVIFESDCLDQCGNFDGENTVCGTECCVELPQACCLADGTCADVIQCVCDQLGGISRGPDTDCASTYCPQPGACCLPGVVPSCEQRLLDDCEADCGVFLGEGISCPPPFYCPFDQEKACCFDDDSCTVTDPCLCEQAGGTVQTANTCPFPGSCIPPPTGACCLPNGTCSNLTEEDCDDACGTYNGDGTDCTSTPIFCAVPKSCCKPFGGCVNTNACNCSALGGSFSSSQTCVTRVCPAPPPPKENIQE